MKLLSTWVCLIDMDNYLTIKSTRGKDLIVYKGFTFGIDKVTDLARYYKCTVRRPVRCPSRGKIETGKYIRPLTPDPDQCFY